MSDIKFLHISDTHFLNEIGDAYKPWEVYYNPVQIFEDFLKTFKFDEIEFVIHTGDLIHDGKADDYRGLKALIDKYVPDHIPVFYTLGNHDLKAEFFEASGESTEIEGTYTYVRYYKGYRLIFLDTSSEEVHHGIITQEMMDWLAQELNKPSQHGSLIIQHHPLEISWREGVEQTEMPAGYVDLMNHPEVRAIFTGHLHMNRTMMLKNTPQYTANSFVFGMTLDGTEIWNTDRLGYHVVKLTPNRVDVFNEIVHPKPRKLNQNIL